MLDIIWIVTIISLINIACTIINGITLVILIVAFYKNRKLMNRVVAAIKGMEEAFECELLGDNPSITVVEWSHRDHIWLVPAKDTKKKD